MSRIRFAIVVAFSTGLLFSISNRSASGALSIVSQGVAVDQSDKEVLFSLVFNQPPNFTTTDSYGRHEDSFQYEIVPDTSQSIDNFSFESIKTVIRGDEIGSGSVLPVRNGFGFGVDSSPSAGGWGPIIAKLPFALTGTKISFDAPFSVLGTTDGQFAYRAFTTNYGATVSSVESVSIPLPTALPIALVTLILMGAITIFVRRPI